MEDDESEGFDYDDGHLPSDPSIITISDDDGSHAKSHNALSDAAAYPLDLKPWKDFNDEQRYHWEEMYSLSHERRINDSWESTEAYHKEKDEEMALFDSHLPLLRDC